MCVISGPGGAAPPGAVYRFAPDWKEEHVLSHLANARGILQADGYKGYANTISLNRVACSVCAKPPVGRICGATSTTSGHQPIPRSPARRSTGSASFTTLSTTSMVTPADVRHAARQKLSQSKVEAFFVWPEQQLSPSTTVQPSAPCARSASEKNWLFAEADTGADTLARVMTIIETAKLNDLDPQAYLADILDRIHDHKINRLDELLPWNWVPIVAAHSAAAGCPQSSKSAPSTTLPKC